METAYRNLKTIKCYKHNNLIEYVDLEEVPKFGTRILCLDCPYYKGNVNVKEF